MTLRFRDDPDNDRYVAEDDGDVAASTNYHVVRGGRRLFDHTVTNSGYEGRGVASQLVQFALDDMLVKGHRIVPQCPFVAGFVDEHPQYEELVDRAMLAELRDSS